MILASSAVSSEWPLSRQTDGFGRLTLVGPHTVTPAVLADCGRDE